MDKIIKATKDRELDLKNSKWKIVYTIDNTKKFYWRTALKRIKETWKDKWYNILKVYDYTEARLVIYTFNI